MEYTYKLIKHDVLDSTNLYALREFDALQDSTVITASRQTSGCGRLGRKWLSEGKGIYFTVVLKNAASPAVYASFSHLLSVSVSDILSKIGLKPQIKWPNDVLCSCMKPGFDRGSPGKICGMLAQAAASSSGLSGIALGAGINYSHSEEDFTGLIYPAASIKMLKPDCILSKEEILWEILGNFFMRKASFEKEGFPAIYDEYVKYCGFLGREIKISVPGGKETVFAERINADGTLSVISGGKRMAIAAADILP